MPATPDLRARADRLEAEAEDMTSLTALLATAQRIQRLDDRAAQMERPELAKLAALVGYEPQAVAS